MSEKLFEFREPSSQETGLLRALVSKATDIQLPSDWLANVRVQSMADGGMGSLRLSQVHVPCDHRAEFKLSAEAEARRIPFTTEATKRFPPASRYPRRESSNQKDEAAPENAFGRMASDIQFTDEDGVRVIASLYLDQTGQPFELDIWKTDFSRLLRIPERFEGVE